MRSDAGKSTDTVAGGGGLQGPGQSRVRVPPGLIADIHRQGDELTQGLSIDRQNRLQKPVALAMKRLTCLAHLMIPGRQGAGARAFLESGVALPQSAPVALQDAQIGRFHVEQCPIHELSAKIGAIGE